MNPKHSIDNNKFRAIALFFFIFILAASIGFAVLLASSKEPMLLIISYDGFRYDYVSKNITPTFELMKNEGVFAKFMKNVFITKTFPNHHSIATGLFPETHGVLASSVYDPKFDEVIAYSDRLWKYSNSVMPLWTMNENSGHRSGVFMWPGGEFDYSGTKPTFVVQLNRSVEWTVRVDTVLSWFTHPTTPINLAYLYFEEPDYKSHLYGPDSEEVLKQIIRCDNISRYLIDRLSDYGLTNVLDVFFLSDHGMESVTSDRIINITQYANKSNYVSASASPALHVIPKRGYFDDVYHDLKAASFEKNFNVYKKDELLERWHYKCDRTPPLLLLADEGYVFDDVLEYLDDSVKDYGVFTLGAHGYDNNASNMHSFFIAMGPSLKRNYEIAPFDSVDLYSLFCEILNIDSHQTNGSLANVKLMLADDKIITQWKWIFSTCIAVILLFVTLAGLCSMRAKKKNTVLKTVNCNFKQSRIQSQPNMIRLNQEEHQHLLNMSDLEE